MPTQPRVGLHEEARPASSREDAADRGEQRPIGRLQLGTWDLSTQDGELVAQHEDLQVLGGAATGEEGEQLDGAAERQVGELRQHRVWPPRGRRRRHTTAASWSEPPAQRPCRRLRTLRAAGVAVRLLVFAGAVYLAARLRQGKNWARVALAVLLGGIGTLSLVSGRSPGWPSGDRWPTPWRPRTWDRCCL